jgi:hypothetical protein
MANGAGCAAAPRPCADREDIVRWYGVIVDINTEHRLQYRINTTERQIHRLRGFDQDCPCSVCHRSLAGSWAERS